MASKEGASKEPSVWTTDKGDRLQAEVDRIFNTADSNDSSATREFRFSFTIADPSIEGCPLIGCSSGFTTLCGYHMEEIVGRNCRFLVDPVPIELVDQKVRRFAREFCEAISRKEDYILPREDAISYMPADRHSGDGIFCVQTNARKDGSIFKNMFYLKAVQLSDTDGSDHQYIIGLQSELPDFLLDCASSEAMANEGLRVACRRLDQNMAEVERVLAGMFWFGSAMRRQDDISDDGFDDGFSLED
jgi:hypothetical protein